MTEYDRFTAELTRRGHAITAGAELDGADRARTVRPGGREVTDGPFAALGDAVEIRPATSDESRS